MNFLEQVFMFILMSITALFFVVFMLAVAPFILIAIVDGIKFLLQKIKRKHRK